MAGAAGRALAAPESANRTGRNLFRAISKILWRRDPLHPRHPCVTASPLSLEVRANGSRECAPDDRLREPRRMNSPWPSPFEGRATHGRLRVTVERVRQKLTNFVNPPSDSPWLSPPGGGRPWPR